jgi:hypothetical protein
LLREKDAALSTPAKFASPLKVALGNKASLKVTSEIETGFSA